MLKLLGKQEKEKIQNIGKCIFTFLEGSSIKDTSIIFWTTFPTELTLKQNDKKTEWFSRVTVTSI